jgi:multicomponent Na+:H+ antiporter subunit E
LLPKKPNIDLLKSIKYVFWLIAEIIKSSISVSKIAWRRNISIYPLLEHIISGQNTELGVVIYANSITLTPGTVTLSTEDNKLLVHALDIKFMRDLQDGTMDRKIEEIIIK